MRWLHEIDIDQYPNVKRWFDTLSKRAGVQRGMALLREHEIIGNPSEETREVFFGKTQITRGRGNPD